MLLATMSSPALRDAAIPPDWSQFLPDLINAGFTGAVVALIVWRLQLRHDRKEAEQNALDDWQRLKGWLRPNFGAPLELLPENSMYSNPARELRDVLQPYPIEEWARLLPKNTELVALAHLEEDWRKLFEAQARIRALVPSAVRQTEAGPSTIGPQVHTIMESLVRGRIAREPIESQNGYSNLRQWNFSPESIEAWVTAAVDHEPLAAVVGVLHAQFETVRASHEVIRDAVYG